MPSAIWWLSLLKTLGTFSFPLGPQDLQLMAAPKASVSALSMPKAQSTTSAALGKKYTHVERRLSMFMPDPMAICTTSRPSTHPHQWWPSLCPSPWCSSFKKKCSYAQYAANAAVPIPSPGRAPLNRFHLEKIPLYRHASLSPCQLTRSVKLQGSRAVRTISPTDHTAGFPTRRQTSWGRSR